MPRVQTKNTGDEMKKTIDLLKELGEKRDAIASAEEGARTKINQIEEELEEALSPYRKRREALEAMLAKRVEVMLNKGEFDEKKTVVFDRGLAISVRRTSKIVIPDQGATILAIQQEGAQDLLRTRISPNVKAMGELSDEALSRIHARREHYHSARYETSGGSDGA